MLRLLYNVIAGQLRANKIARYYGIPKQIVIDSYFLHAQECKAMGVPATLRSYEIVLRKALAADTQEIKNLRPLYCEGLDPLNPYIKE